jgi:hypothetical protein
MKGRNKMKKDIFVIGYGFVGSVTAAIFRKESFKLGI